jgi:hypothetical protein
VVLQMVNKLVKNLVLHRTPHHGDCRIIVPKNDEGLGSSGASRIQLKLKLKLKLGSVRQCQFKLSSSCGVWRTAVSIKATVSMAKSIGKSTQFESGDDRF